MARTPNFNYARNRAVIDKYGGAAAAAVDTSHEPEVAVHYAGQIEDISALTPDAARRVAAILEWAANECERIEGDR